VTGRIVALRALKLGDFLVAVPALRALRRAWPDHRLLLATSGWLAPVVELAGCVDELVPVPGLGPLPPVADRPDVAVNLHGAGPQSNAVLDALRPARRIGHSGHGWPGPPWPEDVHERERWCRLLTAHGVPADPADLHLAVPSGAPPVSGAVLVHPGAAYGSKRWPADRFAAVARALSDDGQRVVITGTATEQDLACAVAEQAGLPHSAVLAGRTDLAELCALTAAARLVVSGDTGIAHVASAYRTPSVVLFGPAPALWWGPPADGPHVPLSADHLRRGDPFAADPDPALLAVSVPEVLHHARALLGQPS
jgi:ADP-heptose:LPS heptosyltransferase